MADARELLIKLTVDAAAADKRLKDIANATKNTEKQFGLLHSKLGAVSGSLKSFAAGLAGAFTLGAMVTAFKTATNSMDEMVKSSQKIGVSVEALSSLNYAAQQSGVSFEGLQTGLKKLNQHLADVDKGTTDAAKALRALGVTGADSPQAAMSKIAEAFAAVPDGAKKTALAMAIFGKAGADLIPMLNAGADGLKRFEDRAKRLGVVMDTETAKQAERFNDAMDDMQSVMGAVVKKISAGMLPYMVKLTETIADSAGANDDWKVTGDRIGQSILAVASFAIQGYGALSKFVTGLAGISAAAAVLFENGYYGKRNIEGFKSVLAAMSGDMKEIDERTKRMVDGLNSTLTTTTATATPAAGSVKKFGKAVAALGEDSKKGAERLKEFEKLMKDLNGEFEKLKLADPQSGGLSKYDEVLAKLNAGVLKLTATERERALQLAANIDAQKQTNDLMKEAWSFVQPAEDEAAKKRSEDIKAEVESLNSLEEKYRSMLNPLYDMGKALNEVDQLFYAGRINADEWSEAIKKIQENAGKTTDEFAVLKDAIDGYAKDLAGAWVSAVSSGQSFKDSFMDITASVLKNIAQMILQIGVIEPMMKRFKESMSGAGGGGGLGSWLGGLFGFAHGGAFAGATGLPHGIYNSPTFFPMPGSGPLQKFARGGVLGEAGPEAILPLRRGAGGKLGVDGGVANVNVNVINNAGAAVSVSQDTNGDTTILIEKTKRAIANDIRRGGTDVASALEGTYRVSRGG